MTSMRRSSRRKSMTPFITPHSDSIYTPGPDPSAAYAELTGIGSVESEVPEEKPKAMKRKVDVENDERTCDLSNSSVKDRGLLQKKKKLNTKDQENYPIPTNVDAGKRKTRKEPANSNKKKNPQGPKKRRSKYEVVSDKLKALGLMSTYEGKGNCARAAIYRGFIKLTGNKSDLDQVVYSGKLPNCTHNCSATLRDLLEQPDYAGLDYEDGCENAVIFCDEEESSGRGDCDTGRTYVTGICSGNPEFDSGQFHNHCNACKKFGKCLGDYRDAHCSMCGKHYFAGRAGFMCGCMEQRVLGGGRDDDEGSDERDDWSII